MRALHGDAHSAVLGTAERLREMLPDNRLVLSVLLTSLAGSSPTEMADWAYERGYDEVIFTFVKPEGRARLRPDLRLSLKRRIELAAEISQVNGRNGIPVYLCGGIPDSRDEWKGRAGGSFRFPDCLHACEEIQILSNGTVLPCGVMYNDRLDVEHWPGVSRFLSAILDHRSTYLIRSPGFACPNLATVSPNENHHLASA
jgi:MoaA/NifB/PqqE/SkfB family radical SAM enzyme